MTINTGHSATSLKGMQTQMTYSGLLRIWNDDRGFGFITRSDGSPDIFVHISAFPRDGSRPTVGEKLTFELGNSKDGKPQATNVTRTAVGNAPRRSKVRSRPTHKSRNEKPSSWSSKLIFIALLMALGSYGYTQFEAAKARRNLANQPPAEVTSASDPGSQPAYRCDGRAHCSQMTSCAEATWFLKHCPGTQMDGNNDGIPCEQQWCTSKSAW